MIILDLLYSHNEPLCQLNLTDDFGVPMDWE